MGQKDREERQLMRQRGAGIRQVKNIGFDLVLPDQENASAELLQPIKSGRSRKTPQPELLPQRSSRRTPKPEKPQLQRSSGKTLATGFTKKRGRPAKKAITDGFEDLSRSRVTQADEEGITMKKRNIGKEQADTSQLNAPDAHSGGPGTTESTLSAVPSTGVKKRKKRKSIGQQSTSRAKATKARSPLKPDRQPRKTKSKPAHAEATEVTDLDEALRNEEQKGLLNGAVPLDRSEPTIFPEVANVLHSVAERVEPSAEELQQETAQKPKKRKRVPVEDLPIKRVKATSSHSKRVPKISKTPPKNILAEDVFDSLQDAEKSAEVETGSLRNVHQEQEVPSEIAQPQKEKPKKRKRVTVGQQSKKRVKAGVAQTRGEQKAHKEPSTLEEVSGSAQSVGKPVEVEVGSDTHAGEEQEVTAGESELQAQKQKPKRKKRKSIGQQKPKRKSMDLATPKRTDRKTATDSPVATRHELNNKPTTKCGRPRAKRTLEKTIEEPHAESLAHLPEEEEAHSPEHGLESKPKARRGRPKTKPIPKDAINLPTEKTNEHAPEDQEETQPAALPEKKKRGRPRKTDTSQPTSQTSRPTKAPASRKPKPKLTPTAPKTRAPPKNTIPITIYAPPSPTSSDAEEDPLTTSHPHSAPTTINAVDVLSQVCSELLSKSSAALAEQIRSDPSSTNKATLQRTKETTDLYAQELASHLLQLTTTLNTNTSLQSRVRAAAKEERRLKKELKQLQKEREDIKGKKEEVVKERKKRELDEMLSGIAGAVKRGWEMQEGEGGDAVAGMVEEV